MNWLFLFQTGLDWSMPSLICIAISMQLHVYYQIFNIWNMFEKNCKESTTITNLFSKLGTMEKPKLTTYSYKHMVVFVAVWVFQIKENQKINIKDLSKRSK